MGKMDEKVLTIKKEAIQDLLDYVSDTEVYGEEGTIDFLSEVWEEAGEVTRRGNAEEDLTKLQIIPSIVIKQDNSLFLYKRLEGSGEKGLVGKNSLTVGGHSNPVPFYWNFEHLIAVNAYRELEEEVKICDHEGYALVSEDLFNVVKGLKLESIIYSERNEVDAVHLGIVSVLDLPKGFSVTVNETDTLEGSFVDINDIEEEYLENWSKNIIKDFK